MVEGIAIVDGPHPEGSYVSFTFVEVLRAMGEAVLDVTWTCSALRYQSYDDHEVDVLERVATGAVAGRELVNGLDPRTLVIDGDFEATRATGERWALVRAIDNQWWEVWTDDPTVLHNVRSTFPRTLNIPTFIARSEWGGSYTLDQMR